MPRWTETDCESGGPARVGLVIRADILIRGVGDPRPTLTGGDHHRVLRVVAGATVTLRHLVIAGGARDGNGGGGIQNAGTLTLLDARVRDNRAGPTNECGVIPDPTCDWRRDRSHVGGGILNKGTMRIVGTWVTDNEAGEGAGVANHGTLMLIGSIVSRNVAGHWSESAGGGILNAGTMRIRRSTVARNWIVSGEGFAAGGGIFSSGSLSVTDSTVSKNHAVGNNGAIGGGIANGSEYHDVPGDLEIATSTLTRNRGGGVYSCPETECFVAGSAVVRSSIVAHNEVDGPWYDPDAEPRPLDCGGSSRLMGTTSSVRAAGAAGASTTVSRGIRSGRPPIPSTRVSVHWPSTVGRRRRMPSALVLRRSMRPVERPARPPAISEGSRGHKDRVATSVPWSGAEAPLGE